MKIPSLSLVAHRVNTIAELQSLPEEYGAEIDVRGWKSRLVLHHDPFHEGEIFENFLEEYQHGLLVVNIKETGIEDQVLELLNRAGIDDHFLLDVEFPYLYKASKDGQRSIAVRHSEVEGIDTVKNFKGLLDWVWLDVNTTLPLNANSISDLASFKTCLVSPDLWGREREIPKYIEQIKELDFQPDAVVAKRANLDAWKAIE